MTKAGTTAERPLPAANPLTNPIGSTEHRPSRRSGTESPARRDDEEIAAKLNEVLATEPNGLDPVIARIQAESIGPEEW